MKIILRVALGLALLGRSVLAWAQCSDSPSLNSLTSTNIETTTATLGADVWYDGGGGGCDLVEKGILWWTTSEASSTEVQAVGTSTGPFTVNVTGLPVGAQIHFRAYARNNDAAEGTGYSTQSSFYTLANEPDNHAANLTATTLSNDAILLEFPPASDIGDADGYVILIEEGGNPDTGNLEDGDAPNSAYDFLALEEDPSATDFSVSSLNGGTEYRFTIIPFNRNDAEDDGTFNYLTDGGHPIASATTDSEIDVDAITNGLAPQTPTRLNSGSGNHALVGFSLDPAGSVTFKNLAIGISSTTVNKFTNFRLCESDDDTFDGVGTDEPMTDVTITPSATEITVTLSETITTTRYFFLVADVEAGVNNSTPHVTFSYDETDFTFDPNNLGGTGSQSREYSFNDATAPILVNTVPADNSTGVDFSLDKLILTFNENVDNINTSIDPAQRVRIFDASTDVAVVTVERTTVGGDGTPTVEVDIPAGLLQPNKDYYVQIGNTVIEDVPADNDWSGISDKTTWNFSTSGVIVNNSMSSICAGSFQPIGNIVISEEAASDFISSGSINLDFADTDFGFDISSVTVSAGPPGNTDITAISLSPKTLTRLTLNYTLDGTNDKVDVITISGLKVYASEAGSTTIVNGSSMNIWAIQSPVTFATINVGAGAPLKPTLETSPVQDLQFCHNEDITNATVAVEDDGGTFTWYRDASLSDQLATGFEVDVEADLDVHPSVLGTVKRYVVRTDGCQSAPLEVEFVVVPTPVADAGPATVDLCSGSSLTIGGSPTLASPSANGSYQYLWATDPLGPFVDMGPNPVVSPTSGKDTTYNYTVKIVDSNGCTSDILDPNATISVAVDSTDEVIIYNSPLSTTLTLSSDPVLLDADPSFNSSYSGNGVYLSQGKYYFDPELAGISGSPHAITYTTQLSNGCPKSDVRLFTVSNASSIINLANSYCQNEPADLSKHLSLGPSWANTLAANNAYYSANYGYTYEFYDFQVYTNTGTVGTGVVGNVALGEPQYIQPNTLQPYAPGVGYAYVGMRVRQHVPALVDPLLGTVLIPESWGTPIFYGLYQPVNLYAIPSLKVLGIKDGDIICDVDEFIELEEANFASGTYEIGRNTTDWVSGPSVGIVDNPANSGKALFNPHNAYVSSDFPAPNDNPANDITDFHIKYTYVIPGTSGSTSSACQATQVISFKISNNPPVAWVPFSETEFCYEAPNASIETETPSSGGPAVSDAITGYGVFDNGNGIASFDPDEGLKQKAFATNSPPYTDYNSPEDIVISATRTDENGCKSTITQTVQVHPLFPATFTESDLNLCYEDGPQDIVGAQPNGTFKLTHPSLIKDFLQTTLSDFNLRTYFDEAVTKGANGSVMQEFKLTFNTIDPALQCRNSVTKTFTVNPPYNLDIVGMTSGIIVCGNGSQITLTGNQSGAGSFEISESPTSGFLSNALGLTNIAPGTAMYNPVGAGLPAGGNQKPLYIRYSFLGAGCTGPAQKTEELVINPQPAIAFSSSIPAANTQYCFEQGASPTTISLNTVQSDNVVFLGYGITDEGGGNATFNPTAAYQQSSLAANMNPLTDQTVRHINITTVRSDAFGCSNEKTVNYIVNPLPPATFSTTTQFCYQDAPVVLQGGQPNVNFEVIYKNTTTPPNYSSGLLSGPSTPFDPSTYFDDAVAKGANGLATLQFDVIYTAISTTTGCKNTLTPVTLSVAPYLPGEMAGIHDGQVFCSNETDREIVFTPPNGVFRIDGSVRTLDQGKFTFDPPVSLPEIPENGREYVFSYEVTTGNNCTHTQTKTIRVLPSPRALFQVLPQCDTALIAYDAETSTNLPSTVYTWNFSGEIKTGQNVEHRFPGVSTYYAKLKVEHPGYYDAISNKIQVCADSLQQDQVVGPYPRDLRFDYFNVCEGDNTNFEVTSTVPINRVAWDFGDGVSTAFGILSDNITGLSHTTGSYQEPVHKFQDAYDELFVTVRGKTSDNFGGCVSTYKTKLSILKKWEPVGGDLHYDMAQLNNGKGFWVAEDRQGNANWEFNTAAKQVIHTDEMAWVTGATEPYNANDISYVNSPCFNLSDFSRPVISIKYWADTEPSDGAVLQYSTDGGDTWFRLGEVASGLDWYNRPTISSNPGEQIGLSSGWSLTNQFDWAVGKHTLDVLPLQRDKVRFRIAFASLNSRENIRDGFAFNNVVIEERNRTILLENFTTLNEQENNNKFKAFPDNGTFNPNELVKLQYHHSPAQNTSPPDHLHLSNPIDQNARAAFYGVTNASRAFIDGGFGQASPLANYLSQDLSIYFSLRSLVTAPVDITLDFDDEPSNLLNVRAAIQATTNLGTPGQYNVFIAIAEQSVDNQVYVLRKFLPSASGVPLTSLSPGDPAQEISVSYDMRHVSRQPDGSFAPFAVIAFVQHLGTKDVLQTVMRQDGVASPEIITGIETTYEKEVQMYPNPADDVLNLILPGPVSGTATIKMFDTFGREVYTDTLETGLRLKSLPTKNLSAGVYLIRVTTPEGMVQKKATITHDHR